MQKNIGKTPPLNKSTTQLPVINLTAMYRDKYIDIDRSEIDDSHIHSIYEIYINVSGNVSFLHNSKVYPVESGDIIFSAPGDIHHCIYHESGKYKFYCLWFSACHDSCVAKYIEEKKLCGYIRLNKSDQKKMFRLIETIYEEEETESFENTLCFYKILEILSSNTQYESDNVKKTTNPITEVLEYIGENFIEINSIEETASKFYMSPSSLNRKFRNYTGLSPYKYLTAKKLAYAEKKLRDGMSVTDACFASGFGDCSRFIEQFRKKYGMTPLKYKQFVQTKQDIPHI